MLRFMTYFLIAMVLSTGTNAFAEDKNAFDKNAFEKVAYKEFRTVESFGRIIVSLHGSAEEIGLNKEELTDYLRLRFRNSFAGMDFKETENLWKALKNYALDDHAKAKKTGTIKVRVWTIGERNPIAYHVKIESGNLAEPRIFEDEFLGFGSKKNVPDGVRDSISQLIDALAIAFLKARDEF